MPDIVFKRKWRFVVDVAGAITTAQASPNVYHIPGHWQWQPGAHKPWEVLPVIPTIWLDKLETRQWLT